ncbi:TRAP transporter substrate-binding protein [Acuticoccus yangtzensis]|uniref:TRAP transporter substrate-binding protein n=1 Tax=Acuticoccus yangtzensis TaxID=1443441 RepID=UPI000949AD79|nr:TRAP transporter substrate-binding protein [Acuticoccus yangtzensis]
MKTVLTVGALSACLLLPAAAEAQEYTLRVQSLLPEASVPGQNLVDYFDDVTTMSGGRVTFEPFFSSAVVKSAETFDAVVNGILDGDTTQPSYQVGKDKAFQFVGDPMGGYDTPWQMYAWLYEGGGIELARDLYAQYGMFLVGWWVHGPESLSSTKPLANVADLKGWKFRSPPGMETEIFANLGASPIVMDFTEVFTGLESGVIDGADASNLSINKSLGLYDIADHATYPGFHSMPADHFAIRLEQWEGFPDDIKRIVEVGWQKLSFRNSLEHEVEIARTAAELKAAGKTLYAWTPEDRKAFREGALKAWDAYGDSERAKEIIASQKSFIELIGLIGDEK